MNRANPRVHQSVMIFIQPISPHCEARGDEAIQSHNALSEFPGMFLDTRDDESVDQGKITTR